METGKNEPSTNVEPTIGTTRRQLAEIVRAQLNCDIEALWTWLQKHNHLPANLPADWDPISGPGGVYEHWTSHEQPPGTKKRKLPKGTRERARDTEPKPKKNCRACTIMHVIWRCWLASSPRRLHYVRDFELAIVNVSRQLSDAAAEYRKAAMEFAKSHKDRMAEQRAAELAQLKRKEQADGVDRSEMAKLLADPRATRLHPALQVDFAKTVVARIRDVRIDLLVAHEAAAVLSGNSMGPTRRLKGAGQITRFETELWKMLRDAGFSDHVIGEELVRPACAPRNAARCVSDRLRKTQNE